jgi:PAS domain S-box-containing protein
MSKDFKPRAHDSAESSSAPWESGRKNRREPRLWRAFIVLLALLLLIFGVGYWRYIHAMPLHVEALAVSMGALVLAVLAYAWNKASGNRKLRPPVRYCNPGEIAEEDYHNLFSLISRSQQGYRDLIDSFDDLLFSIGNDGTILSINRSFADLLNLSYTEIVGRTLNEFFELPEGDDHLAEEHWLPRFLQRRRWTGVVRVRVKPTGSLRYFDCVLHAIVRDNAVQGISGYASDVTRERESETRFTELFETLREGVYLASADDRITEVNPALAKMLGYQNLEDLLNREVASLYRNPEERAEEQRRLQDTGFLRTHEVALKHHLDGRDVVAMHTTASVRGADGKFVRYQGTFVDVTEQREMERRLYREQEFGRRLMDSFPDLVVALDTAGRFTFVSPQIFSILGFRPEDWIGNRVGSRMDPEDRAAMIELFDDLILNRVAEGQIEFRAQHKNGDWRVLRASLRQLHDEIGNITGVIASARDITDWQRLQQQMIQSERLAAMGQMIAGVAHELNNPLTAILGVTELLLEQTPDGKSRHQLDIAHRQAHRAAHIVQSLLVFSRPSTPRSTLLHLTDLLKRTLQLHEHSLRVNHIQVELAASTDIPTVLGDANQLTQVFLNLIINAEQAIREVRERGTLWIRLGVAGERVTITFQDDGVGIRRELLPHIFDPFFTTKRPGRGTGLGLSICMAIVREHRGDISAQPLPDGGSVFTVSLPVCTETPAVFESAQPSVSASRADTSEASVSPATQKRILVIDDEESILELVNDTLTIHGYSVDRAALSDQALELANGNSYDVILCDLNLESGSGNLVSGFDLYDRILSNLAARSAPRPLFIFMTGDLMDAAIGEQAGREGNYFLQKPFRIGELLALLNDLPSLAVVHSKDSSS